MLCKNFYQKSLVHLNGFNDQGKFKMISKLVWGRYAHTDDTYSLQNYIFTCFTIIDMYVYHIYRHTYNLGAKNCWKTHITNYM